MPLYPTIGCQIQRCHQSDIFLVFSGFEKSYFSGVFVASSVSGVASSTSYEAIVSAPEGASELSLFVPSFTIIGQGFGDAWRGRIPLLRAAKLFCVTEPLGTGPE